LLIVDEVQSGFGRTGKFFGFDHAGIVPDIIVMAKGLGSGMPISAIGASEALMRQWKPGTHGGTYGGGNALALVAAKATIDVIRDEKLVENAAARRPAADAERVAPNCRPNTRSSAMCAGWA
jgi:4-aminobutyrate aminotransferase